MFVCKWLLNAVMQEQWSLVCSDCSCVQIYTSSSSSAYFMCTSLSCLSLIYAWRHYSTIGRWYKWLHLSKHLALNSKLSLVHKAIWKFQAINASDEIFMYTFQARAIMMNDNMTDRFSSISTQREWPAFFVLSKYETKQGNTNSLCNFYSISLCNK